MGTGALFSEGIFPPTFQRAVNSRDPIFNGPELVFVRLRSGVSAATGRVNLEHIVKAADKVFAADPNADGDTVAVIGVQRPAQIVNYRTIGSTPIILAVGIAVGAIVALAITLIASVRHRRRDLAVLKVLGFTPRQLSALVAWQSTVAALIGIIVGVPCGIILGRQLWTAFARGINAVPDATVPVVSVILVAIGALIFANVIAAIPGRLAARTPTALVLRAE
jgi:ABC-type antimicrobial peptide transport system permease subunit